MVWQHFYGGAVMFYRLSWELWFFEQSLVVYVAYLLSRN